MFHTSHSFLFMPKALVLIVRQPIIPLLGIFAEVVQESGG